MNKSSKGPASSKLRASAICVDITPNRLPVLLGGFARGEKSARTIESRLEANVVALTDGESVKVIVSLDILYVTARLREKISKGLAGLGLEDHDLFLAASHTHYAPTADETKPILGGIDYEWVDRVASDVIAAVHQAMSGPFIEIKLEVGQGRVSFPVSRRKRRLVRLQRDALEWNKVGMSPNPHGDIDDVGYVVRLRAEGSVLAVLWSVACHPTGCPDQGVVSSAWPGKVRDALRDSNGGSGTGNPLPVLFLQGFAGDVRPPSGRPRYSGLNSRITRLRLGPAFHPLNETEYKEWTALAADEVLAIAASASLLDGDQRLDANRVQEPAALFASSDSELPPVTFHRLSIGQVQILGASAEVVSGYADKVRSLSPESHVITVGYIDHVIGYWPTDKMFKEGGYEAAGHCPSFSLLSCAEDIESRVMSNFRRVLGPSAASG